MQLYGVLKKFWPFFQYYGSRKSNLSNLSNNIFERLWWNELEKPDQIFTLQPLWLDCLQCFDHFLNIFLRYTLWCAMVACHFLFTSTQFVRLFSSKISKMSSINVGNQSKMVCIVNFCEFWILLFFTGVVKCLFDFLLATMFPRDRMIWDFIERLLL